MRQRPTRSLGNETQALLIIEPVNLINHAVNLIGKIGARL